MKEQLITFDTAKLAKEKGFNWVVERYFDFIGDECSNSGMTNFNESKEKLYSRPTQSLLQKWLYETKLLWVEPIYNEYHKWFQCVIYDLRTNDCLGDVFGDQSKTPFEALEKGLQEALKLI